MNDQIILKGVRTHNLKQIDAAIPHRSLVVVTGVSGSGKSSLAFDTLYAEGRRRYVESLSAYARQFLERIEKPDVEFVGGILPAIAIEAKNVITNARSTVGTQTELSDYLRLLFARIGVTHCSSCAKPVRADSPASIWNEIRSEFQGAQAAVTFPLAVPRKSKSLSREMLRELERQGFLNFWIGGRLIPVAEAAALLEEDTKSVLVAADQLEVKADHEGRFLDSLESALRYGKGAVSIFAKQEGETQERKFSTRFQCAECNLEYRPPDPNLFSFNSPLGACPDCQGFGRVIAIDWDLVAPNPKVSLQEGAIEPWTKPSSAWEFRQLKQFCRRRQIPLDRPFGCLKAEERKWILEGSDDKNYFSVRDYFEYLEKKTYRMHVRIFLSKYRKFVLCPACGGARLKPEALAVRIHQRNIADLNARTIETLKHFFETLTLSAHDQAAAEPLLFELRNRLSFLAEVGLGYLTLDRLSRTLSGGEAQRIHLAASLGSALVDTLYVLDEPSVGLHERDNALLIRLLRKLKELGNTVVVVEHDRTMIEEADQVIDLGPLGGERGGKIVFSGPFKDLVQAENSHTARYFRGELEIKRNGAAGRAKRGQAIRIHGAAEHNLKGISLDLPLGELVVITGVSGSGKSTLMYDVLYGNYRRWRGRPVQEVGRAERIEGFEQAGDLLLVDQSPIGRTPRSNPVTYVKAFDAIRRLFASTRDAKLRRLGSGHFSFNVSGGRCETCEGCGKVKVEMHFLADVFLTCEACGGTRYQSRILEIRLRGKNIRDVLDLTVAEALEFFEGEQAICAPLEVLNQVGLGYLRLGQSATTLSGGEAQRLKLAAELTRAEKVNLLYLFDEPTTGLHYYDIRALLAAFETLLERGHSLCVIEHNMEVIKCADYIIDLGPEGGDEGGYVVYAGPLSGILEAPHSHTGAALRNYLRKKERDALI